MYNYLGNISDLSHHIIDKYIVNKNFAVDATLGNGHDTDFLYHRFKKVISFDIQKISCEAYREKDISNVEVINDSHHKFDKYIHEEVDCIMYNLGFLPGGNKEITTMEDTTMKSIEKGLNLLSGGGIMTLCVYRGHDEGKREEARIISYLKNLPKDIYGVMNHTYMNRNESSPILIVIEKKNLFQKVDSKSFHKKEY